MEFDYGNDTVKLSVKEYQQLIEKIKTLEERLVDVLSTGYSKGYDDGYEIGYAEANGAFTRYEQEN